MVSYRSLLSGLLPLLPAVVGAADSIGNAKCSSTLSAAYPPPSMAAGYVARLVANGLTSPRDILFDKNGALLVVEQGVGVTALTLKIEGQGCISQTKRKLVIDDSSLNHGIELSRDGSTLYASSPEAAYSWAYSATKQANTSAPRTLINNMTNTDHTTRTLLLPRSAPDLLLVTRGSTSNIDPLAEELSSGHSQIKAFNLTKLKKKPYDFESDGTLLGWGLRNDVGIAEEPTTGGIYTVENSVDQLTRNGVDIHNTNPAEELNFMGVLNKGRSSDQAKNFGYPVCLSAWNASAIPNYKGKTGQQFAFGDITSTNNDEMCSEAHKQKARIVFHPHMAPLDILFNDAGDTAWVSFHGSWDSTPPVGYKVGIVKFNKGDPVEPATSLTALTDIMSNADVTKCYSIKCFRPVGLAWDKTGNMFVSSDATGEIYAILRADGKPTNVIENIGTTAQKAAGHREISTRAVYPLLGCLALSCAIHFLI